MGMAVSPRGEENFSKSPFSRVAGLVTGSLSVVQQPALQRHSQPAQSTQGHSPCVQPGAVSVVQPRSLRSTSRPRHASDVGHSHPTHTAVAAIAIFTEGANYHMKPSSRSLAIY